MFLWSAGETDPLRNGHPLFVWPRQGAGRVDDRAGEYLVLYAGDSPEGAVAEALGNYARWTTLVLDPPPAAPPGSVLALARCRGELSVRDLDDPHVLVDLGLRPSAVVTRERAVTQGWARSIFDSGGHAGVSWWSYRDPRWRSYGIWDRSELSVVDEPEPLAIDHPALLRASEIISRVIAP